MELFNKNNDNGSFESFVDLINNSLNDDELVNLIQNWKPNIEKYEMEYWIKNVYSSNIEKINFDKLPIVLDVFFKSNDRFTFMLFCMILEVTIDELPYLTNLENERLIDWKWDLLKNTISTIIKNSNSALVDCIFLILLNNDPTGKYLTDEEKNDIISGINNNLEDICKYLSNNKIDENAYTSIEIVLDASTHLNNEYTNDLIEKISNLNLNDRSTIFLLKYQLVNNMNIDNNNIEKILNNKELNYIFFNVLDSIHKLSVLNSKIDQGRIAISKMIDWLMYPTELGKLPSDIKEICTLEIDELIYYLFKFKSDNDSQYMLGIVGGYEKNKLTTIDSGIVFSNFEQVEEDYKSQGLKLIEQIQNYWKNRINS